ncbi:MAG: hypothetical protein M1840_008569 [Geoglossum simile]|nr:MAG: hypothetical protein M1840_008569 [Geoglossum simile]
MASKVFGSEPSGYSHRIRFAQAGTSSSPQVNSRPTSDINPSASGKQKKTLPPSAISSTTESVGKGSSPQARGTTELPPMASYEDTSCKMVSDTVSRLKSLVNGWDSDYPEIAIPVTVEQFRELLLKVREDGALDGWFEDKARYEYNAETEKLFFRCPSSQHEHIVSDLTIKIANEANHRSNDSEVSQHARHFWNQLQSSQSSNVNLIDRQGKRSIFQPDVSFIPSAAQNPSFVTEIAYSQIEKDLAKRAEKYIHDSNGDVSTVMGIKIQYPEAENASLTIWKAIFKTEDNEDVLAIDQNFIVNSQFIPGEDISLSIANFAGPDELENIPDDDRSDSITLSLQFFYDIVMKAKQAQEAKSQPKRKRQGNTQTVCSKVRPDKFGLRGISKKARNIESSTRNESSDRE